MSQTENSPPVVRPPELSEDFVPTRRNPKYFVNPEGRVWSSVSRRFLTHEKHDYLYVSFGRRKHAVHILVAEAFVHNPDPDRLAIVMHKDDCRYSCSASNLTWGSHADNTQAAIDNGSLHSDWNHKLSHKQILDIYADAVAGELAQDQIASKYGVSRSTVSGIKSGALHSGKTGATYSGHSGGLTGSNNHKARLSEEQVGDIYRRFLQGESMLSLAGEYGVSFTPVWMLCRGRTWNHVTGLPKIKPKTCQRKTEAERRKHNLREPLKQASTPPVGLVPLPVSELTEDYSINRQGVVYSHRTGTILRIDTKGRYPRLAIQFRGRTLNFKLHRLLAMAFVPNPKGLTHVRHLDDNPKNYAVSNLAWGTSASNAADAARNGRIDATVLTDEQVVELTRRIESGELTQVEAAREYGSTRAAVSMILLGQTRRAVTGRPLVRPGKKRGEHHGSAKLSNEVVLAIVNAARTGSVYRDLARQMSVSPATITMIMQGKIWSSVTGIGR